MRRGRALRVGWMMRHPRFAPLVALAGLFALAGCAVAQTVAEAAPPAALADGGILRIGKPDALPGFVASAAQREAFRRACPALLKRTDASGLTRADDWKAACADPAADPQSFFQRHFTAVRLGSGTGLATGYFEPEIAATRDATPGSAPILRLPPGYAARAGPQKSRSEIESGALAGQGLELAYASDPIALFFLQIQGSGLLRFPDGRTQRIGFAGHNGHPYVAIGRLLRARGLLDKAGMAEIIAWLRANPAAGQALMRENPRYIFFRPLPDSLDGPVGALGIPLLAEANAAIDPAAMPLGAPLFARFATEGVEQTRLLVASDTGSAIKGPNRIDIFWGQGDRAAVIAGSLAAPAEIILLLPDAAARRLGAP